MYFEIRRAPYCSSDVTAALGVTRGTDSVSGEQRAARRDSPSRQETLVHGGFKPLDVTYAHHLTTELNGLQELP